MKVIGNILKKEFPFILGCPAIIWQVLFLYMPLLVILGYSFISHESLASNAITFTLAYFSLVLNFYYMKAILATVLLALSTTVVCLLVAYPIAYFIAFKAKRMQGLWLFFLILPSMSNLIIQVYAWFFILQRHGAISTIAYKVGITSSYIHLLNNEFAIITGMVYCFLPFMIFPIFSSLSQMDPKMLEASADLGANRLQTFFHVVLPLSLRGVATGCMLVFVPAFGEYVIIEMLGGSKNAFWGSIIVNKFLTNYNLHTGAALVLVGMTVLISFLALAFGIYKFTMRKTGISSTQRLFRIKALGGKNG
ncbi:ABC transporter permease [bacterium]|nr:ABC transporter permease [bacterium]